MLIGLWLQNLKYRRKFLNFDVLITWRTTDKVVEKYNRKGITVYRWLKDKETNWEECYNGIVTDFETWENCDYAYDVYTNAYIMGGATWVFPLFRRVMEWLNRKFCNDFNRFPYLFPMAYQFRNIFPTLLLKLFLIPYNKYKEKTIPILQAFDEKGWHPTLKQLEKWSLWIKKKGFLGVSYFYYDEIERLYGFDYFLDMIEKVKNE